MYSLVVRAMMEAVRTSETLVNINLTTWQNIAEEIKLNIRRRENLKSHESVTFFSVAILMYWLCHTPRQRAFFYVV
jgi:hypothetical protein